MVQNKEWGTGAGSLPPGKKLAVWRRAALLRQSDLADLCEVSQTTVSNWERGASPVPDFAWLAFDLQGPPTAPPPAMAPTGRLSKVTKEQPQPRSLPTFRPMVRTLENGQLGWGYVEGTFRHLAEAKLWCSTHEEVVRVVDSDGGVVCESPPRRWRYRAPGDSYWLTLHSFASAVDLAACFWARRLASGNPVRSPIRIERAHASDCGTAKEALGEWEDVALFPASPPLRNGPWQVVCRSGKELSVVWSGTEGECRNLALSLLGSVVGSATTGFFVRRAWSPEEAFREIRASVTAAEGAITKASQQLQELKS